MNIKIFEVKYLADNLEAADISLELGYAVKCTSIPWPYIVLYKAAQILKHRIWNLWRFQLYYECTFNDSMDGFWSIRTCLENLYRQMVYLVKSEMRFYFSKWKNSPLFSSWKIIQYNDESVREKVSYECSQFVMTIGYVHRIDEKVFSWTVSLSTLIYAILLFVSKGLLYDKSDLLAERLLLRDTHKTSLKRLHRLRLLRLARHRVTYLTTPRSYFNMRYRKRK